MILEIDYDMSISMEFLDKRISRILGQMRGIQKMVKEEREGVEVLQQVSAVKKAIDALTKEIILIYFKETVPENKMKEIEKIIKQAINL